MNRYANLVGTNKIKDEWTKINTGFDAVQADRDSMPVSSIYRQALINAGLEAIQRFGPLGSTTLATATSAYVADRVKSFNNGSGANAAVSQVAVSDLDGATSGLKIVHAATPTAGGQLAHTYTVEAKDSYKLAGQQVVYAVKVLGVSGMNQVTINARYKTSESAISSASTLVGTSGVTAISNTGWTVIPVVVTLPTRAVLTTSGVIGFEIVGSKTTAEASGDGFIISEIELIKADKDLGFQPRSFPEEFQLCLRYYQILDAARVRYMDATSAVIFTRDFFPKRIVPIATITVNTGVTPVINATRVNSIDLNLTNAGITDSTYTIKLDAEI